MITVNLVLDASFNGCFEICGDVAPNFRGEPVYWFYLTNAVGRRVYNTTKPQREMLEAHLSRLHVIYKISGLTGLDAYMKEVRCDYIL